MFTLYTTCKSRQTQSIIIIIAQPFPPSEGQEHSIVRYSPILKSDYAIAFIASGSCDVDVITTKRDCDVVAHDTGRNAVAVEMVLVIDKYGKRVL